MTQPYRVVSTNGVAQIQCVIHPQSLKYPYPEEARVTVLKGLHGHQELCFSILNFTDQRETRMEQKEQVIIVFVLFCLLRLSFLQESATATCSFLLVTQHNTLCLKTQVVEQVTY